MFDLHSHILPGIDDGAVDVRTSIEMARAYVEQGVRGVACTPHILPGVYPNTGPRIRVEIEKLRQELSSAGIDLELYSGADNHVAPDFVAALAEGRLLSLADSRYVLVEPPHHVAPPRLDALFFQILSAGYVPVLTHPERLSWIEDKYALLESLADRGAWIQVTSGSLRGVFGQRARYWSEKLLSEGRVHLLASDAHDLKRRRPDLLDGYRAAERLIGAREAESLVVTRPHGILSNMQSCEIPLPGTQRDSGSGAERGGGSNATGSIGGHSAVHSVVGRLRRRIFG
mgnify:CR=1 FL=1